MTVADLDAVMAVEVISYAVPWTRGNFIDSLAVGYHCHVLRRAGELVGYVVSMSGVEELHLLNITVAPPCRGEGHARRLLDDVVALCRKTAAQVLWLEVRHSNERARALYERYGFSQVGLRRAYYPQPPGETGREDAVVMSLNVPEADDGVE
ncbi:MAG: hypothetical protein RLZZ618_1015 [Pseudomonadota bacterium]|jgi:ribosomal-protein-alanine N-acetyltransferase